MFVCFKCRAAFAQYKLLARHLRHHHSLKTKAQAKTQLTCVQDGCNQQFQSPAAFRKHLVKHSNNCEGNDNSPALNSESASDVTQECQFDDEQSHDLSPASQCSVNDLSPPSQCSSGDPSLMTPVIETPVVNIISKKKNRLTS